MKKSIKIAVVMVCLLSAPYGSAKLAKAYSYIGSSPYEHPYQRSFDAVKAQEVKDKKINDEKATELSTYITKLSGEIEEYLVDNKLQFDKKLESDLATMRVTISLVSNTDDKHDYESIREDVLDKTFTNKYHHSVLFYDINGELINE